MSKGDPSIGDAAPIAALCRLNLHSEAATALAYSRVGESDPSPEILRWHFGRCEEHRVLVLEYVALRIVVHAARCRITADADGFALATIDALECVRRVAKRRCPPASARALQCHMRKQDFIELRRTGEIHLLRAISRGLKNYLAACGVRELCTPGSRHTVEHDLRIAANGAARAQSDRSPLGPIDFDAAA